MPQRETISVSMTYINTSNRLLILPFHQTREEWRVVGGSGVMGGGVLSEWHPSRALVDSGQKNTP